MYCRTLSGARGSGLSRLPSRVWGCERAWCMGDLGRGPSMRLADLAAGLVLCLWHHENVAEVDTQPHAPAQPGSNRGVRAVDTRGTSSARRISTSICTQA